MSILIRGIEMPNKKSGAVLIIYPDGKCTFEDGKTYQAVPVPKHGRLIDADAMKKNAYPFPCAIGTEWAVTLRQINDAPTIIPAEEETP